MKRISPTMQEVLDRLDAGERLWWHGDHGPEISGRPFWPQKRTVRAMLARGLLVWCDPLNETQRQLGMRMLRRPEVGP